MAPTFSKKRKLDDPPRNRTSRPKKKFRKQTDYASSSSPSADEFDPVDLAGSESEASQETDTDPETSTKPTKKPPSSTTKAPKAATATSSSPPPSHDSASDTSTSSTAAPHPRPLPKRKDPSVFSTSLSTILATKLPLSTRGDPVLARSASAKDAAHALADGKLESKARRALRDERKSLADQGRVRDVVLGDRVPGTVGADEQGGDVGDAVTAAGIRAQESRLRKTAQRGVVKLFNAVRAAQVKGEEARREARRAGVVGAKRKEERVGEMGRKAFLELVAGGGVEG
ncbi:hypothetical protein MMC11_002063 [Xylographa trunciseda]|nr:hypothetical protein [Xylographa trunciseda]